jgi:hypothetical protein
MSATPAITIMLSSAASLRAKATTKPITNALGPQLRVILFELVVERGLER